MFSSVPLTFIKIRSYYIPVCFILEFISREGFGLCLEETTLYLYTCCTVFQEKDFEAFCGEGQSLRNKGKSKGRR